MVRRPPAFGSVTGLASGAALIVSGTGPQHAELATRQLIDSGACALVSWGCAGALAPELRPGDLLIPNRIIATDDYVHEVEGQWLERLTAALPPSVAINSGTLAESAGIVATPEDKQSLYRRHGAVGVDMESAGLARAAAAAGLPFLVIRAIADTAGSAIPAAVLTALTARGDVHLGRLLGYALHHPRQFVELVHLGRAFAAATDTLRAVSRIAGSANLYFAPAAEPRPTHPTSP